MAYSQNELSFPDRREGYRCRCCNLFVKEYVRSMNSNMALSLIVLYKNASSGFVHLEKLVKAEGYQRCGDASYLRHWGFIEAQKAKREDGSPRNGMYRITGRGMAFVTGGITAKKSIVIFDNEFLGFEGDDITIQYALGNKFDFNTLMGIK